MSALATTAHGLPQLFHKTAIRIGQHAVLSRRNGFAASARMEFWIAYHIELQARKLAEKDGSATDVLTRSAAILAFHAGVHDQAAVLAEEGLRSWMPEEIAAALREVIRRAGDPTTAAETPHDPSRMPVAAI